VERPIAIDGRLERQMIVNDDPQTFEEAVRAALD
jgi:hypothetical protein